RPHASRSDARHASDASSVRTAGPLAWPAHFCREAAAHAVTPEMAEPDLSRLRIDRGTGTARAKRRGHRLLAWALAIALLVAAALYWRSTAPLPVQTHTVSTAFPSQVYTLLTATGYVVAQRKAAVASKAT